MITAEKVMLDRPAFLAALRSSGLVADAQLDQAVIALPPYVRTAREAAEVFVSDGLITRFQAERLLVGRSEGFHIGPYVILEHLGKSATGRVFKARHRTMNRFAAIKMLAPELTATAEVQEAIRTEARQAAKLTHPNLVTLLDVNHAGGRMYFVKEFLDGAAIGAILREVGWFAIGAAGDIVRQVSLGLQHAHEKGIAHGRLSPSAILVGQPTSRGPSERPPVKVSGFGLGRFAAESDFHANDFEYRAPEQFEDPSLTTPAADIYSLGCVLFHMLAGQPPFPAAAAQECAQAHRQLPPPPISYYRPEVPPAMASLLLAMLAKNPDARPSAETISIRLAIYSDAAVGEGIDLNVPAQPYSTSTSILQQQTGIAGAMHSTVEDAQITESPFEDMTEAGDISSHTPVSIPRPKKQGRARSKKKRRKNKAVLSPFSVLSVLLISAIGVALILAFMLKRASHPVVSP